MLDLKADREPVTPKDAATIVLVRDRTSGPASPGGIEVFCVERNKATRFMGGAIVFPGGKLDPGDSDPAWEALATAPRDANLASGTFSNDQAHLRSLAIAAARETLEEATMLHVQGGSLSDAELLALRTELASSPDALRTTLAARSLTLDLGALAALSRWITPTAESRRFDARFFVAIAPPGQTGAHDDRETTSSFWASPDEVLRRFEAGEVQLMPPTERTLRLLASCATSADVIAMAAAHSKEPICPRLVPHRDAQGETMALVLPGDPDHDVKDVRTPGPSRYVLRGEQWRAEDAPR